MPYSLTNEYVWKEIGDSVVVVKYETGAYWTLNETASFIWKEVLNGTPVQGLVERVCATFDADPEVARADVDAFLDECVRTKMLLST
jgi:hypothetical protein